MEPKVSQNIYKATGRIEDELSEIKDKEIELERRKLRKNISRELYLSETNLLRQKEKILLLEKEDFLTKVHFKFLLSFLFKIQLTNHI